MISRANITGDAASRTGPAGTAAPTDLRQWSRTRLGSARRALDGDRALLVNAASLFGTTAVTSLFGFGFWWLAARIFPVTAVGYASAAVSALMMIGVIGMLGLGTVLINELARRPPGSGSLLTASLLVSGIASAVLGLGFVLVTPHLTGRPMPFAAHADTMLLFALGAALTGTTFVLDQALIGLLRGELQLFRNIVGSVARLVLLAVAAVLVRDRAGIGILVAWVVGTLVSMLLLARSMQRRGIPVLHLPDWVIMRRLSRSAASHNWLNMTAQLPGYAMPVLATGLVSPAAGAGFYVVWNILNFITIVPFHLSTVLQAIGAADVSLLRRKLRFTLRLALLAGAAGVPVLVAGAGTILSAFGPDYAAHGTGPLRVLAFGYFSWVFQACYVSVCRVHGLIVRAAVTMTIAGLLELGAAATGAVVGGLMGLSVGLLAALCLVAGVTAPRVLRAATLRSQ